MIFAFLLPFILPYKGKKEFNTSKKFFTFCVCTTNKHLFIYILHAMLFRFYQWFVSFTRKYPITYCRFAIDLLFMLIFLKEDACCFTNAHKFQYLI